METKTSKTCAIIASGPSLNPNDCEIIRTSGVYTIAVNNSWEAAPFCDVIFAGDVAWWKTNCERITIDVRYVACERTSMIREFESVELMDCRGAYNSGAKAIEWAIKEGFKDIILLGFDCSLKNGAHWHGRHENLGNPKQTNIRVWHRQFSKVAKYANRRKATVTNCSRYTELTCFKTQKLEKLL